MYPSGIGTLESTFGVSSETLAELNKWDPATPPVPTYATAEKATLQPPPSSVRALVDPKGSAIFWVMIAAVLGLVLVSGRLRVEAALGGRAGKA